VQDNPGSPCRQTAPRATYCMSNSSFSYRVLRCSFTGEVNLCKLWLLYRWCGWSNPSTGLPFTVIHGRLQSTQVSFLLKLIYIKLNLSSVCRSRPLTVPLKFSSNINTAVWDTNGPSGWEWSKQGFFRRDTPHAPSEQLQIRSNSICRHAWSRPQRHY
jgi:hypothetical protein